MVKISADVSPEVYQYKISKRIGWNYLIEAGINSVEINLNVKRENEELKKKIEKMSVIIDRYASLARSSNL